ncbi:unnamed protein product [Linum trigynum]|uniref:Uncharacterized protein n=1 Tax=Linum trigynum TaxID=586398 RepID=A0AAV2CK36_9ROSI
MTTKASAANLTANAQCNPQPQASTIPFATQPHRMTSKVVKGIEKVTLVSVIKTVVVEELKTAMIVEITTIVGSEIRSILAKILTDNHQQNEEVTLMRQRLNQSVRWVKQLEQRSLKNPVAASTRAAETKKTVVHRGANTILQF